MTSEITEIQKARRGVVGILGGVLAFAGVAAFAASVFGMIGVPEANLLLASGGAIALGLILVAASLFVRVREEDQVRLVDAQLFLAKQELKEALQLSGHLHQRFKSAETNPPSLGD